MWTSVELPLHIHQLVPSIITEMARNPLLCFQKAPSCLYLLDAWLEAIIAAQDSLLLLLGT